MRPLIAETLLSDRDGAEVVAQRTADDVDLTPPAFLRRQVTPETRARAMAVVREVNGGARDWKPMRGAAELRREEARREQMAKYNQLIVNKDAPVEVFKYASEGGPGGEPTFVRNFDNLAEFEKWFCGPPTHRDLGVTSTQERSTVLLDIAGNPNVGPRSTGFTKPGYMAKVSTRQVGKVDKPYIVNSHVGMVLRAAGFSRKPTPDGEPLTFSRGDDECVVVPPAPDKKSSSVWLLKASGRPALEGVGPKPLEDALKGGGK